MTAIISTTAVRLITNLEAAAQAYGWASDQGSGEQAKDELKTYKRHRQALVKYIADVERHLPKEGV
jgi:hypothetical protein